MTSSADIRIRSEMVPGDLGYLVFMHGSIYGREYGYGMDFEKYVARSMLEFYDRYDESLDRIWICEHDDRIVASLVLMHRESGVAQLRYFLIDAAYRGCGLGKKLMGMYMEYLHLKRYKSSYLLTTSDLSAAASLYRRHGFVLTETKESTTFGRKMIEQRYDLILPS